MRTPAFLLLFTVAACGGGTNHHIINGGGDDSGGGGIGDMSSSFPDGPPPVICQPGSPPICDGDVAAQTCNADGLGYTSVPCPDGTVCTNGVCNCAMGSVVCMGNDIYTCGGDGMLHLDRTCPNTQVCSGGHCDELRCPEEHMITNANALPVTGWPRYRHDNRNSGSTPVALAAKLTLKWKTFIGGATLNGALGGLGSGPVVNQSDIIFIGGGDKGMGGGSLVSLDSKGKMIYSFAAMRGFGSSTPAVRADGTAYFASQNAHLYAVDPMGKQVWTFQTGSQADGDPIVTKDGNLIYSSDDGSLYSLDPNGKLLWKSDPQTGPGEVDGGLAESCDGRIFAAGRNGWFSMDAMTGKPLFSVPATGPTNAILSSPIVTADGRMFGFDSGGKGVAIDAKGKVIWSKVFASAGGGCSTGLSAGVLYAALNDGGLHAIDATTGVEKWNKPIKNHAREIGVGPITDGNGNIYINSSDGNVYAFDTTGKQLWVLPHSGQDTGQSTDIAGTMAIGQDGTLYVPGNDGSLYAFQ